MAETAYLTVSDDLDTIRRSLVPVGDLTPHLARFLAACSGTLRTAAVTATDHVTTVAPGQVMAFPGESS
ncbi:hypothetical protein [Mobilicoccus massiliensis]|uniref:hypothetical protein n=1 Tax=Mobilicoccus massiliensis TaxID=1522310 RepID=UPI00058E9333|nr:hypothetical protein [Mobilicoccus massiliensis]